MIENISWMMKEQEKAAEYLKNNVKKMLEVTTAAASGDLSKRIKKERDDDVGRLADGLNNMIKSIDSMIKEQKEQKTYLEDATEKMGNALLAAANGDLSQRLNKEKDDDPGAGRFEKIPSC